MQSRIKRKRRHAAYREGELDTLRLIVHEQSEQIAELRRLVHLQRLLLEQRR